jgi:hypothetical protein
MSNDGKKMQGEGDRDADRRYRENVRQFVDENHVGPARRAAERALDGAEGVELRAAEEAGKARIAEEDPQTGEGPLPSFWTDEQQSAWDRVKEALHRDWIQTKADFGLKGGAELDQTAKDTMKQAAGKEPIATTVEGRIGWEHARHAMRLGHGAATFWSWEATWTGELESRMRGEWDALENGVPWEQARPLVLRGWEMGRKDIGVRPPT